MAADDFVGRIGINVHFSFPWTYYDDRYVEAVQLLKDANIRTIRDHVFYEPGTTQDANRYAIFRYAQANGLRMSCIVDDRFPGMNPMTADKINYFNTQSGNLCSYYEGQNEPDLRSGWTTSMIENYQRQIFDSVNGSSRPEVPVAGPSVTQPQNADAIGPAFDAYADKGNMHPYHWGWYPSTDRADMEWRLAASQAMTPDKPMLATEYGWSTEVAPHDSGTKVTENVQSKYTLRGLFWGIMEAKFEKLIFYELYDEDHLGAGQEARWAIVRGDGTPKPAYTSLKRMTNLLVEPYAPAFTPQPLSYSLSSSQSLADIKKFVLQKSNGTHYLVLYQNVSSWDGERDVEVTNPDVNVTVNLGAPASHVLVHRPHSSATPVADHAGPLSSVNVSVADHPVVVEVLH
jgi:hypothetical protein